MQVLYFHIRFIFLSVLIIPICQNIAGMFVTFIAIITKRNFAQILLPDLIDVNWFSPETYANLLFSGIYLSAVNVLLLSIYSIYYIKHRSFKVMVIIWIIAGVLITFLSHWRVIYIPFFILVNSSFPWLIASSAIGYAFAAFLVHSLMGLLTRSPKIKKSLVEIFR